MKMDSLFGARISQVQHFQGVTPHIIIPANGLNLEERDALFSSLPITPGHLIMADKNLSFLLALISEKQKSAIALTSQIKHVGNVNVDIEALSLLVKDGMRILSNPKITKDIS